MKKEEIICGICGSKKIVYSRHTGEYICRSCGYIIRDKEQRYYKPYRKQFSDKKISTNRNTILTRYHRNYKENLIEEVKDHIEQYGEILSLPSIDITTAKTLLYKVVNKSRWNRKYLALGLLYVSNRYNSFDKRTMKEFMQIDKSLDSKKFRKTIKNILKYSNVPLKYRLDEREIFSKFYENFGYNELVDITIEKLYDIIRKHNIIRRKSPKTIYTTIAYLAYKLFNTKKRVTLKSVTEISKVSEVPIRNTLKEILREVTKN